MTRIASEKKLKASYSFALFLKQNHYFQLSKEIKQLKFLDPSLLLNRKKNGQINLPTFIKALCKCSEDHIRTRSKNKREEKGNQKHPSVYKNGQYTQAKELKEQKQNSKSLL